MLQAWWVLWWRRRGPDLTEGAELRAIGAGDLSPPSDALCAWLADHGRGPGALGPAEARRRVRVWEEEYAVS
eukprot:1235478-Alexandrium_andersonii.AAC.1